METKPRVSADADARSVIQGTDSRMNLAGTAGVGFPMIESKTKPAGVCKSCLLNAMRAQSQHLHRKIDRYMLPIMFCCYTMQFID